MKKITIIALILVSTIAYGQDSINYNLIEKDSKTYLVVDIAYSDTWRVYNKALVDGKEQKAKLTACEILFFKGQAYEQRAVEVELKEQTIYLKAREGQYIKIELKQKDIDKYNILVADKKVIDNI